MDDHVSEKLGIVTGWGIHTIEDGRMAMVFAVRDGQPVTVALEPQDFLLLALEMRRQFIKPSHHTN